MDRRDFLRWGAVAVGGAAAGGPSGPLRGAEPSRGLAGPQVPEQLGVQLYTVRAVFPWDFVGVLEAVRHMGYSTVEFAGYHGRDPAVVRAVLDDVGLTAPSTHVSLAELEEDAERVLATARAIGHRYVVVPSLEAARRPDLDGYRRVAEALNAFGARARESGVMLGYHNHAFEFETFGSNTTGFDVLIESTDPELVAIEMDLFWTVHAGADPVTYIRRHPGRFHLFHVKDRTADGSMVDVGAGAIDFRRIFAEAETAGLRHAIVEHDNPEDPLASIRSSHDHLAALRA